MNPHSAHAYKNFLDRRRSIYGNHSKGSEVHRVTIEVEDLESLQADCLNYNVGLTRSSMTCTAEELTDEVGLFPVDLLEPRFFT
jgi:hypothetical protein